MGLYQWTPHPKWRSSQKLQGADIWLPSLKHLDTCQVQETGLLEQPWASAAMSAKTAQMLTKMSYDSNKTV